MKKKIQKPFDVEAAKNGAKIETKCGDSVRILCYDRLGPDYPIMALVNYITCEMCYSYTIDGKLCKSSDDNKNLVIIDEIESRFDEGDYIVSNIGNIYEITRIDDMYHTRQLSSGYEQRWTFEDVDRSFHKWTKQDAKPGSVLCCEDGRPFMVKTFDSFGYPIASFGIDTTNHIFVGTGDIRTDKPIRLATFREYNSLFKQLRQENYEYNINTHEITKQTVWRNKEGLSTKLNGYYIGIDSKICPYDNGILCKTSYNVFATKKQAKAALAMARISQIMANDERFGGSITNDEVGTDRYYVILRRHDALEISTRYNYEYLAFHTKEQAELFLKENEDLIKDYYMMN